MNEIIQKEYSELLRNIKELVRTTQLEALKQVNTQSISMYWNIGENDC